MHAADVLAKWLIERQVLVYEQIDKLAQMVI
jgi:hypothetical protein